MDFSEVRAALGVNFSNFKRNEEDAYPCDHYASLGCFVYYSDTHGLVDSVEFYAPAKLTIDGVDLFRTSAPDLLRKIEEADPSLEIESDGFTSRQLGIGAWYPRIEEEPMSPAESVIVFARGYYD
jgi:hypothetical protein